MQMVTFTSEKQRRNMGLGKLFLIAGGAAVGMGVVATAPVLLVLIGFTPGGMTALAYSPSLMYAIATGGLLAFPKSAALSGVVALVTAVMATIGGGIGAVVGWLTSKLFKNKEGNGEKEEKQDEEDKKEQ